MANSLESGAEEDEKKNGIFLFSPQQITARKYVLKRSKNPNRLWNSGFALSETKVLKYRKR